MLYEASLFSLFLFMGRCSNDQSRRRSNDQSRRCSNDQSISHLLIYTHKSSRCVSSAFLNFNVHPCPRSVSSALTSSTLLSYVASEALDLEDTFRMAPTSRVEGTRLRLHSSASSGDVSRTREDSRARGRSGRREEETGLVRWRKIRTDPGSWSAWNLSC